MAKLADMKQLFEAGGYVEGNQGSKGTQDLQIYKSGNKTTIYPNKESVPEIKNNYSVSFNKETGNIKISAPQAFLNTQTYKEKVKPALETISLNYKLNPEYKYALLSDSEETKTSEDWLKDINNELPQYVSDAFLLQNIKDQTKKDTGLDLTDEQVIKMSSIALERKDDSGQVIKVGDDTVQSLPEVIKNLKAFQNLQGWQNGEVSYKNLMGSWNRENTPDEDLLQVYDTVSDYFKKGEFNDADEYAEMVAFSQFIEGKHPETGFWRGAWDGITNTFVGVIQGLETVGESIAVIPEALLDFAGRAGTTTGTALRTGKWEWAETPATGRMDFFRNDVGAELDSQKEIFRTNSIRLNEAAGTVGAVVSEATPLVMQLIIGNALGRAAARGVTAAASKMLVSSEAATTLGGELGMTAEQVASSVLNGTNFLMRVMSAEKANAVIASAVGTLKAMQSATAFVSTTTDLAAQVVVDVAMTDQKLFRQLLDGNVSNEVKEYLLEQVAIDAGGWAVAAGAIKTVKGVGKTDIGRVVNAAIVPRVNKWASKVGEYADTLKVNALHSGDANWNKTKADTLRNRLETEAPEGWKRNRLENRIGAAERRQQNLTARRIERRARAQVGELPGVAEGASSWSDVVSNANRIKIEYDTKFTAAHALADRVYKNDVSARITRIKTDVPTLDKTLDEYTTQLSRVIRAEDAVSLKRVGKVIEVGEGRVLSQISKESNEYVLGTYRAMLGEDAKRVVEREGGDIRGIQKEIDYYTNATQKFREKYPELATELDRLRELGKGVSAATEDARFFEGVLTEEELVGRRGSEYFQNGYLRTQRVQDWDNYQRRGGALNINQLRDDQHLKWGFEGEAPSEYQDITFVLFDDVAQVAKQSIRRDETGYLRELGETVEVEVSGEEVRMAKQVNATKAHAVQSLQNTTNHVVTDMDPSIFNQVFEYKRAKSTIATATTRAAEQGGRVSRATIRVPKITRSDRIDFVRNLDTEDLDDLILLKPDSPFARFIETEDDFQDFVKGLDRRTKQFLSDAIESDSLRIFSSYSSPESERIFGLRQERDALQKEYDDFVRDARAYENSIAWSNKQIPKEVREVRNKALKKISLNNVESQKDIAKRIGFRGKKDDFSKWFTEKKADYEKKIGDMSDEITSFRGVERPMVSFENRFYSPESYPVEYLRLAKSRQSISDNALGSVTQEGSLANRWINSGDVSAKGEIRSIIENDPRVRSATLSTMYKNSGSKLPFNEWLDTPIVLRRQQAVDTTRDSDAFMSFSMYEDWKGTEGFTPRTETEEGDIVTLSVRPRDTLGQIPHGIRVEDRSREVLIPREVYSTAMTRGTEPQITPGLSLENFRRLYSQNPEILTDVKRQYVIHNKDILDDEKVTEVVAKIKQEQAILDAETLYAENIRELKKIQSEADLPGMATDLNARMDGVIDNIIGTNRADNITSKALETLDEGEDIIEYATLKSLTDRENMAKTKERLWAAAEKEYNKILTANNKIEKDGKTVNKLTGGQIKRSSSQWAKQTADWYEERVNQRFGQVTSRLRKAGSDIVDYDDLFAKVEAINKDITDAGKANDIVKTYDDLGREEYVRLSPTVADLITTMPTPIRRGLFGEIQAQFVKVFRMGTTGGLVPQSLIRQWFRDSGLAVSAGNVTRSTSEIETQLTKVYGSTIADYYQQYMPNVWDTLRTRAEETGEAVERLATRQELSRARTYTADQMQSNIYRLNRQARMARNPDGVYAKRDIDGIKNKLEDAMYKTEKLNNIRETNRRVWVYNNAYLDALNNGHSVPMARRYAEMIQAEATTNFSRQTYHLANLTNTVPYLGAAINGSKSFWRLMAMDPVGITTRIVGGYVVPLIALTNISLSDPENREIYKQIPEYEKDDNLIFVLNGQKFSIPIPQEISSLVRPIQTWLEVMQGANDHSIEELVANNLAGFFPYELQGFVNVDADRILMDDTFENIIQNHLFPGFSMLASQLMGPLLKSGVMAATGYDPYTRKKINTAYTMTDPVTGESVVIDYKSGELAKALGNIFKGNFGISAQMAQAIFNNLLGSGNMTIIDGLSEIAASVPMEQGIGSGLTAAAQRLGETSLRPLVIRDYGELSNQAWNRAVSQLYGEKEAILNDPEYKADLEALYKGGMTAEAEAKVLARVKTKREEFQEKVLRASQNLIKNYDGGTIDQIKFATIISLMTFSSGYSQDPTDPLAKQQDKEAYQLARAKAVETMAKMGFTSPNDSSIFGHYVVNDRTGEIAVELYTPLTILNFEESTKWQSDVALANIRTAINEAKLWDAHESVKEQIDAIYNKKNKTKADNANLEAIQINWNAQVAKTLAPYISKMTPEAAINNTDVLNYLYPLIEVPYSWEVNNRGRSASLGSRGNRKRAYYESWIRSMFKVNDRYKGQY